MNLLAKHPQKLYLLPLALLWQVKPARVARFCLVFHFGYDDRSLTASSLFQSIQISGEILKTLVRCA
jgi:hypothetical protein